LIRNKQQFESHGKEEAEVVALYLSALYDAMKACDFTLQTSAEVLKAAAPAVVKIVSGS
jgi:hypothetical protein